MKHEPQTSFWETEARGPATEIADGKTVLVHPPSRARRERLVALVHDAIERWGPDAVRLVSPSPIAKERFVRGLLARSPRGTFLPEIVTLDTLARTIGAWPQELPSDGVRRTLLAEILRARSDAGELRVLGERTRTPGWVRSLDHFFSSLARQRVRTAPHLETLLARYRSGGVWGIDRDVVVLYGELRRLFPLPSEIPDAANAFRGVELVIVDGFETLAPHQLDVLGAALAAVPRAIVVLERSDVRAGTDEGSDGDETARALRPFVSSVIVEPEHPDLVGQTALALARNDLDALPATRPEVDAARLTITRYADPKREVEAIAHHVRRSITSGKEPGDLAVCFAGSERHLSLARELFPRLGIPFRALTGIPLVSVPPVALRFDLLRAVAGGYRRAELDLPLRSPYLRSAEIARRAHALASLARVRGGGFDPRHTWVEPIRRFADASPPAVDTGDHGVVAFLEGFFAALGPLEEARREPIDAGAFVTRFLACTERVIASPEELGAEIDPALPRDLGLDAARARDRRALDRFTTLLEELRSAWAALLPPPKLRLGMWLERLELLVSEETIAPMEESPRGVVVASLSDLRHLDAREVFIGALTEENLPRAPRHAVFYPPTHDPERDFLRLPDPRVEDVHALMREVALRDGVHLSWPARVGEADALPAVIVDRLGDVMCCEALEDVAPPAVASSSDARRRANALARQLEQGASPHTGFLGASDFPRAEGARYAAGGGHLYSVTTLERVAQCGFRFFAEEILGLGEPDVLEEEIPPRLRGKLLHEILHAFLLRVRAEPERLRMEAARRDDLALELGRIAEHHLAGLPSGDLLSDALRASLTAGLDPRAPKPLRPGTLAVFLDAEIARRSEGWVPEALEWSFGARDREVSLPAPEGKVRLKGKIDRVDRHPDGSVLILDYKSGAVPAGVDAEAGVRLQLELYLLAYEMLGEHPPSARWNAAYLSLKAGQMRPQHPTHKDRGVAGRDLAFARERTAGRLGRLTAAIAAGSFPVTVLSDAKAPCRVCAYASLCRVDRTRARARRERLARSGLPVYLPEHGESAAEDRA